MFSAADQTAPDWDCAGELGTKLQRTLFIQLNNQLEDPDLRLAQFYTWQDLVNALLASPYYASQLTPQSGMTEVGLAIGTYNADGNHVSPWTWNWEHAEGCFTYENQNIVMCPLAEDGACCLPSGECTQLSEEACADITGEWLGSGEPCPETAPVGQVEYVSTGLDTLVIGNFNNLSPVPALWSPASTTDHDYIQAISSAEPATPFVNYYFEDTQHPAMTQEAAPYWCAGDNGNSLKNVMFVRLTQAFTDPALRNTEHHSFAELANAVRSSAEYSDLPTDVDWAGLKNAITYTDPDIGVIQPYVIISRLASLCYEEVQPMLSTCPAPIACCLPEGCYQLSEAACLARGGDVVGEDCNDDGIECGLNEDPGACCTEGNCLNVDVDTCHLTYQGVFYSDTEQCHEQCEPIDGACCLEDGSCIDATENSCNSSNGDWLGAESDCASLFSSGGSTLQSTGWDNYNGGVMNGQATLAPYGATPTSWITHLDWMSINQPDADFSSLYFQAFAPAIQTEEAYWQCAGDQGNQLRRVIVFKIAGNDSPELAFTNYYRYSDLLNAVIDSGAYPSINEYSSFIDVLDEIQVGYGTNQQTGTGCYESAANAFECPVKNACCVNGECSHQTEEDCEALGGTIVGDSCDDPNIECVSTIVPCCINGACLNVEAEECLASGGALAEGDATLKTFVRSRPAPAASTTRALMATTQRNVKTKAARTTATEAIATTPTSSAAAAIAAVAACQMAPAPT